MVILSFQEALNWLNYCCDNYKVFTKNGKLKSRQFVYLALTKYIGSLTGDGVGEISVIAGAEMDMDKYGFRREYTKLYGIYYFKDKKEIDNLTETRYNEIISELQKQYKEKIINEKENKIKEDFND